MENYKRSIFAFIGGYGVQYWTGIAEPTIYGKCQAISICKLDVETGNLMLLGEGDSVISPSTLVVSPDNRYVYTTNETSDFEQRGYGGGISAFRFDHESASLKLINQSLSFGAFPAYISIDKTGKFLLVANHGSKLYCTRFEEKDGKLYPKVIRDEGCICLFSIDTDGGIGELLDRIVFEGSGLEPIDHASAHPHSIMIDEQDYIIVSDKGADCLYSCRLNRLKEKIDLLATHHTGLGTSPRHAVFVKGTDYVVVINEYDGHLNSFSLNRETGELLPISRIYCGDISREYNHPFYHRIMKYAWANDVQIHPNGRFIYANIDQSLISLFYINHANGELQLVKQFPVVGANHGTSRGMQIDPSGNYLMVAGLMNEKVFTYRINQSDGEISYLASLDLPTPTAISFTR